MSGKVFKNARAFIYRSVGIAVADIRGKCSYRRLFEHAHYPEFDGSSMSNSKAVNCLVSSSFKSGHLLNNYSNDVSYPTTFASGKLSTSQNKQFSAATSHSSHILGSHQLRTVFREFQTLKSGVASFSHRVINLRQYGSKKSRKSRQKAFEDGDDSDSDEDIDMIGFEGTEHHDEDKDFPQNFKTVQVNVKSPRVDTLLAAGLNISRSKVEDYFYGSKLRLNGEKVLKKSRKVEVGDSLDLIMETNESVMKVKRVRILAIAEERTSSDRAKVLLKAWRSAVPVEVPKREFGKSE